MASATAPTRRRPAIGLLVALLAAVGLLASAAAIDAPEVVVATAASGQRSDHRRVVRRVRRRPVAARRQMVARRPWSALDRGRRAALPATAVPGAGISRRGPLPARCPR